MGPNHPTALLRDAKQQFKSIGHFGLRVYLEACPTGRIVNNVAINHGSFRANDYFGLGIPARRANASKISRIHYRPLPLIRNSSDRLTDYPENFVSVYGYRNTSCGGQRGRPRLPDRKTPPSGGLEPRSLSMKPRHVLMPGFAVCREFQQHVVFGRVPDDEGNGCRQTFNMKGACILNLQIRNACDTRPALRDVNQSGRRSRPS